MAQIMLRMVSVEGGELTGRRVPESELVYRDEAENQCVQEVLNKLIDARLIVKGKEADGEAFVEPAHDALVRGWDKLLDWTRQAQEQLMFRRLLTPAANDWKSGHGGLWHFNPRLSLISQQLRSTAGSDESPGRNDGWLNAAEAEFVEQSVLRRQKTYASVVGSVVIAFTALSLLTWFAYSERDRADGERQRAERELCVSKAQRIALLGNSTLNDYPQRAVILAAEAVRMTMKDEVRVRDTEQSLHDALEACSGYGLAGHDRAVTDLAFSSNGRWLASGSADGTVRLWDVTSELPIRTKHVFRDLSDEVNCVAISPDSRWLVVAGRRETAFLYDLQSADPTVRPIALQDKHNFLLEAVAFSPDSRLLVTGGQSSATEGIVYVWYLAAEDVAASGKALKAHSSDVMDLAFSPNGQWLASGCSQVATEPMQFPLLWDFQDPSDPKGPVLLTHGKEPKGEAAYFEGVITDDVAFAPNSRLLATTSRDGYVRLWMLNQNGVDGSPKELAVKENVRRVCFSADGRWLAGGGFDTVFLWDLDAKDVAKEVAHLDGQSSYTSNVCFTSDSKLLFNTSEQATHVWNIDGLADSLSHTIVLDDSVPKFPISHASTFRGHEDQINTLAVSMDDQWLATGSDDGTCRLLKIDPLRWKNPPTRGIHRDDEYYRRAIAFDPKSRLLAAARADEVVALWDLTVKDPLQSTQLLPPHKHWVNSVEISPNGRMLATVGIDTHLWILGQDGGRPIRTDFATDRYTTLAAFDPRCKWLATACGDGSIFLWEVGGAHPSYRRVTLADSADDRGVHDVDDMAISTDGRRLVAGSRNGIVRIWNIENTDKIPSPVRFDSFGARVELSTDGKWLFKGHLGDAKLYNLDAAEPAQPCATIAGWSSVDDATFCPNAKWMAASGGNNEVSLWSLATSPPREYRLAVKDKFQRPFRGDSRIHGWTPSIKTILFSPDGNALLGGSNDSTIYIWDLRGPARHPTRLLRGHTDEVNTLSISANGRWLLSGSDDSSARLWDLHDASGEFSIVLKGEQRPIEAVKISRDGKWACATSLNNSTSVWPLTVQDLLAQARLAAGRNFSREEWELYRPSSEYKKTFEDLPIAAAVLVGDEANP